MSGYQLLMSGNEWLFLAFGVGNPPADSFLLNLPSLFELVQEPAGIVKASASRSPRP